MSIQVEKSDIWIIGHCCWGNEGSYFATDCNVDSVNHK